VAFSSFSLLLALLASSWVTPVHKDKSHHTDKRSDWSSQGRK
jgi:hypothetical protein